VHGRKQKFVWMTFKRAASEARRRVTMQGLRRSTGCRNFTARTWQ
jgi:hypothetical protein